MRRERFRSKRNRSSGRRTVLSGGAAALLHAHLGEHPVHGVEDARDRVRPEIADAADPEGIDGRELAWIDDIAAPLERVVEDAKSKPGSAGLWKVTIIGAWRASVR